jgi:hypothetical protein
MAAPSAPEARATFRLDRNARLGVDIEGVSEWAVPAQGSAGAQEFSASNAERYRNSPIKAYQISRQGSLVEQNIG